jgi:hypothetical protein
MTPARTLVQAIVAAATALLSASGVVGRWTAYAAAVLLLATGVILVARLGIRAMGEWVELQGRRERRPKRRSPSVSSKRGAVPLRTNQDDLANAQVAARRVKAPSGG